MKKIVLLCIFIAHLQLAKAQSYFQQEVNYKIDVRLDDVHHFLFANEEIVYKNNSSTTLNELYFHLYPNAYKNTETRLAQEYFNTGSDQMLTAEEKDMGYIDSLDFQVNGKAVKWSLLVDTIDICKITLPTPLAPGASITITTPFRVKIPSDQLSRMGHDGQAYYITQWYPKPAVFDKNGWNYFSYLDKGEYYSEFGSFDVTINLPENYVVGATGDLVNGEKELAFLDAKAKETAMITEFPTTMDFPKSSAERKTLHYYQDRVHDFAWFADKRWHVLKGEVELPISKRKVTTWSMFTNAEAEFWKLAPEYIARTIRDMSTWVGEYPYNVCTAVDIVNGQGNGMEYPTITAIGSYGEAFELDVTIVHEVAHNWFYGILGSNERNHPWMDEGFTNFCETRYIYTQYANDKKLQDENISTYGRIGDLLGMNRRNHKELQYYQYAVGARQRTDQSQDDASQNISRANYRQDVYFKTSVSVDYLKAYLGNKLFDQCMNVYYENWKFKHPSPDDLKHDFESTSGKDLSWFFNDLMRSNKKIDYSITGIDINGEKAALTLKNKETIQAPLWVSTLNNGKIQSTQLVEGFSKDTIISLPFALGNSYQIDSDHNIPEIDRRNNTIRSSGLFKRTEKINLKFLTGIENENRSDFYYIPVVGYNLYNSVMAGAAFHNVSHLEKRFEFAVMPLYATRSKDLAGGADLRYHIYLNNKTFRKITLQETIGHYAYEVDSYTPPDGSYEYLNLLHFTKFDSRIILKLNDPHPQKKISRELELRNVFVRRDIAYAYYYHPRVEDYNYLKLEYRRINSNSLDASLQKFTIVGNDQFIRACGEIQQFFNYGVKHKGLQLRLFAGYANINEHLQRDVDYRYNLSGSTGNRDFMYDDIFVGRTETEGIWSQQFIRNAAGFTAPTLFYRKATKWMTGLNLSTTLPGMIPFKLYANVGTFNDAKIERIDFGGISYEFGVELPLFKDALRIYLPFSYSADIKYAIDEQGLKFGELIRFEMHLQKLNPLHYIRKI
jgi:hypothetical protein